MTKKSGYRLHRQKNETKPVAYHMHVARVQPEMNNVYAYCRVCGRAMSNVPVKALLEKYYTSGSGYTWNSGDTADKHPTFADSADSLRKLDQATPGIFQGELTKMVDELLGVVDAETVQVSLPNPL